MRILPRQLEALSSNQVTIDQEKGDLGAIIVDDQGIPKKSAGSSMENQQIGTQFSNDRESRGNMVAGDDNSSTESNLFSKEQMDLLQKLFNNTSSSYVIGSGTLAQKGTFLNALNVKKENSSWIVDSGATDHMTGNAKLFDHYELCSSNLNARVADGSLSKVARIGSVTISNTITLHSVLLVPNLDCNLVSISKLTQDLKCVTKFFPDHCVFQDSDSGRMIGSAKLISGLYILQVEVFRDTLPQTSGYVSLRNQSSSPVKLNNQCTVMLWHYRLGHPNFMYLGKMFPELFHNKNPSQFHCEICQYSKHTRQNFPQHAYKLSHPFHLIHSDVWGPSRVNNITGARWFVSFIDDHTRITWIYLMREKSEVGQIFQNFNRMIKNQFQTKIQVLRTDNGKEYFNSILKKIY